MESNTLPSKQRNFTPANQHSKRSSQHSPTNVSEYYCGTENWSKQLLHFANKQHAEILSELQGTSDIFVQKAAGQKTEDRDTKTVAFWQLYKVSREEKEHHFGREKHRRIYDGEKVGRSTTELHNEGCNNNPERFTHTSKAATTQGQTRSFQVKHNGILRLHKRIPPYQKTRPCKNHYYLTLWETETKPTRENNLRKEAS